MNYVLRRNSATTPGYEIPEEIAELFENQLGCLTGGNAAHGLRWEYEKIGIVFFENIKREKCCIYILPKSEKREWKTVEKLQKIIIECGLSHLKNQAQYAGKHNRKNLRVRNVSWEDLKILAPELVEWVYVSEKGKAFRRRAVSLQPKWPPENVETYLEECERAAFRLRNQEKEKLRERAIASGKKQPRFYDGKQRIYERSIWVMEFCKTRADYRCEITDCDYTPFMILGRGENYVEIHHLKPLSEEGEDTIDNVACLCPNHHKEIHYGENKPRLTEELLRKRGC